MYKVDEGERLVAIPNPLLYRCRGKALRNMNRYEYFSCVRVVKDRINWNSDEPKTRQSTQFRFTTSIEIHASHHQILRSKQCTIKLFKNPPPHPGKRPDTTNAKELARWEQRADKFACYYLVLFREESDLYDANQENHYEYNWNAFEEFIQLKKGEHDKNRKAIHTRLLHTLSNQRPYYWHQDGRSKENHSLTLSRSQ